MGRRGTAHLVEIDPSGLRWAKSSASGSTGGSCVEIAVVNSTAQVRCSRNRGPKLRLPAASFAALVIYASTRQN